jgi:hypothetical protein
VEQTKTGRVTKSKEQEAESKQFTADKSAGRQAKDWQQREGRREKRASREKLYFVEVNDESKDKTGAG